MEIKTKAQAYIVDKQCIKCKLGRMRAGHTILTSSPPQIPHTCNKCGHQETYTDITYPYTRFEPIEE
jgi:hypothetical protein